jgi:peptide-methionine (S)-S-oxide reductase
MQQVLESKEIYQGELSKNDIGKIVTEILPAAGVTYWLAEEYHQRYLEKNPNGYDCHSSTGINFPALTN